MLVIYKFTYKNAVATSNLTNINLKIAVFAKKSRYCFVFPKFKFNFAKTFFNYSH